MCVSGFLAIPLFVPPTLTVLLIKKECTQKSLQFLERKLAFSQLDFSTASIISGLECGALCLFNLEQLISQIAFCTSFLLKLKIKALFLIFKSHKMNTPYQYYSLWFAPPDFEHMIYHTKGENANHFSAEAIMTITK